MEEQQIIFQLARLIRERPVSFHADYGALIDPLTPAQRVRIVQAANAIVAGEELASQHQLPGTVKDILRAAGWDYDIQGKSPSGNLDAGYRVKVRIDMPGGGTRWRTIRDEIDPGASLDDIWDAIAEIIDSWNDQYPGQGAVVLEETLSLF